MLGERVVKDDKLLATFDEREAFLEVQPDGRIRQTFFASDTPTEFRGFVQWLAPQLQFVLPHGEAEWSAQRWQVAARLCSARLVWVQIWYASRR